MTLILDLIKHQAGQMQYVHLGKRFCFEPEVISRGIEWEHKSQASQLKQRIELNIFWRNFDLLKLEIFEHLNSWTFEYLT